MCSTSMTSASSSMLVPLRGVLLEERAHGVRDLAPPAVADGDVDEHAVDVAGAVLGGLEPARRLRGQEVEGADGVDPPAVGRGERVDGLLDDAEERAQLGLGTVEVVGGEQPERHDLDADLVAPREEVGDVVGAGLVALARAGPAGTRPAPVAVEHDADVAGHRGRAELLGEAAGVRGVQDVTEPHRALPPACSRAPPRRCPGASPTLLRPCRPTARPASAGVAGSEGPAAGRVATPRTTPRPWPGGPRRKRTHRFADPEPTPA